MTQTAEQTQSRTIRVHEALEANWLWHSPPVVRDILTVLEGPAHHTDAASVEQLRRLLAARHLDTAKLDLVTMLEVSAKALTAEWSPGNGTQVGPPSSPDDHARTVTVDQLTADHDYPVRLTITENPNTEDAMALEVGLTAEDAVVLAAQLLRARTR